MRFLVLAVLLSPLCSVHAANSCAVALRDADIPAHFTRLALKQMVLEFGPVPLELGNVQVIPAGRDLARVEAYLKYPRPHQDEPGSAWVIGWVSRCEGTVIVHGNTWLADGTLAAPRFTSAQLPGKGVALGKPTAPVRLIAYVDSRCSHCHRLIGYARELLAQDAIYVEFRQVAYLETDVEAVKDTRVFDTALIAASPRVGIDEYMEMLGDLNSTLDVDDKRPEYQRALALIRTNTSTARELLHVTQVPAVLIMDRPQQQLYRLTNLTEMNRLFQPDL